MGFMYKNVCVYTHVHTCIFFFVLNFIACTFSPSVSSISVSFLFELFSSVWSNVLENCVPLAWCVSVDLLVTNGMSSPAPAEQKRAVSLSRPSAPALVGLQRFKGVQCSVEGCSKFCLGCILHTHMKGLSESPPLVK